MGMRIHKAIGWGMSNELFTQNIGFEPGDDLYETFNEKLDSITSLSFPSSKVSDVFPDWKGYVFQKNLLAKDFDETSFVKNASDLSIIVMNPDKILMTLFLPSATYLKMYRRDDTLDYIENTHDLSTGRWADEPADNVIVELKQNPYYWGNIWMTEDGQQVIKTEPYASYVPAPPFELRWWLTETGILKPDAWKHLRPYYAKWWC